MRGILDAMYWRLHASFLLNERQEASKFLAMIEDDTRQAPGALLSEIGPIHHGRYLQIRKKMQAGEFGRLHGEGSGIETLSASCDFVAEPTYEEREFCRQMIMYQEVFFGLLGISRPCATALEVEMDPYGRCDILVRHGRVVHVIEVKLGEAKSSVVSQVDKYFLGMSLDMCLGTHDEVRGTVVAAAFHPYVAAELSRMGVTMLAHNGKPNEMRLVA